MLFLLLSWSKEICIENLKIKNKIYIELVAFERVGGGLCVNAANTEIIDTKGEFSTER
jgi:hypothetical protein